jgi:HAD superfamily hydrolase (TIGR01490 family)
MTKEKIAFFDLDKTLIDVNSGTLWVKSEYKGGFITLSQLIKAGFWMLQYHFGASDLEHALKSAIFALKGQREEDVRQRTDDFYHTMIQHRYRPELLKKLQEHQALGHRCVLITTSSEYLSKRVQEDLKLDDILCTRFEVDLGIFTGLPQGDLCFAKGKVLHAQKYIEQHQLSLDQSYFYTDSYSDLPLLEQVTYPVIVHADQRLRKYAKNKNWDKIA